MNNTKFSLYEYDLPLVAPLQIKGGELSSRQGIIVVGEDEKGKASFGEIAPLPYFSTETFPIAREEAITIAHSINEGRSHAVESLKRAVRSVAFGFDSVLGRLAYNKSEQNRSITINALLTGEPENILQQASSQKESGFRSLKVKIGMLSTEKTIKLIKELRHILGDNCQLRLDANRSLSVEKTLQLTDQLADIGIEYLEEPVGTMAELKDLIESTSRVRLALDESLLDTANDSLLQHPQVTTLVIKPTILGPFRTRQLIDRAGKLDLKVVISSSYESPIGIAVLVEMAASIASDIPCGLDTLSIFADNPFGCHDWINDGRIKIDDLPASFDLSSHNYRRLV